MCSFFDLRKQFWKSFDIPEVLRGRLTSNKPYIVIIVTLVYMVVLNPREMNLKHVT